MAQELMLLLAKTARLLLHICEQVACDRLCATLTKLHMVRLAVLYNAPSIYKIACPTEAIEVDLQGQDGQHCNGEPHGSRVSTELLCQRSGRGGYLFGSQPAAPARPPVLHGHSVSQTGSSATALCVTVPADFNSPPIYPSQTYLKRQGGEVLS